MLIAWKPERYGALVWVPFFAQAAVFFSVGYSMLAGDTGVTDGILALAISGVLAGLLGFVWITEQRTSVIQQYEAKQQQNAEKDSGDQTG